MMIAFSNCIVIYINLTRNLGLGMFEAILIEIPLLLLTAFLCIFLYREIFQRTMRL